MKFSVRFLAGAVLICTSLLCPGLLAPSPCAAEEDASPQDAKLLAEIRGIFAHHCYKCHSSDKKKGELQLDSKEGVFAGGENGKVIEPGNADASDLLHRVLLPAEDDDAMPPEGNRLDAAQISLLRDWIAKGAPWPNVQAGTFRRAPLALTKPPVPEVTQKIDNPVDAFVDRYFAQQEVKWPGAVSDELFLRRVYLDVIGLLPTFGEVSRFQRDKDPAKRSRVARELLDRNSDYALHWMTFWNDALRNDYAGTGYIDGGRTQISAWLYQALATNKPFDQFTHELISPADGADSGGFINGIQWRGVVNASQVTEMQAAQSLSQVFLGLNLKCASCHDSFINDWKLDDAYGLANVFATEPMEIHRCDQATGRMAETRFLFPELGTIAADAPREERMKQLADRVVSKENGRLPRTIVNRLWARLLGRGLVEPVDEMDLLPWDSELLDWLASDFVEHGYDLKHTMHRILSSRAYGLKSVAMVDANALTAEDFAFRGPVRKRLSAEQFADAVSEKISPLFAKPDFVPPVGVNVTVPELPETLDRAKWVWLAGDNGATAAEPGVVYFRKTIRPSFARKVLKAEAFLTADNAFEFSANGTLIGSGDDWNKLHYVDCTDAVKNRQLEVEIKVTNTTDAKSPAGLFGVVIVTYTNSEGKEERLLVPTYEAWKSARSVDDSAYELSVTTAEAIENLPSEGRMQICVAVIEKNLHVRIFDANGKRVIDKAEAELVAGNDLKKLKALLVDKAAPPEFTPEEKLDVIGKVKSVADYDGFERSEEVSVAGDGHAWNAVHEAVPMNTGFPGGFVRAVAVQNNPFLTALGRPARDTVSTGRISAATLLEALEITNGAFLDEALKAGAKAQCERSRNGTRLIVQRIYREFLGRACSDKELAGLEAKLGGAKTTPEAVQDLLWAILVSPEFQIIY
jgi:mono/diheme cytochrome c family protein